MSLWRITKVKIYPITTTYSVQVLIHMFICTGVSNTAQISWTKKAILTAWTKWTECSISCVGKDGLFGERTRQRKCMEGFNNDHTCQTYSISGVQFTSDLIEIGTSSCPTPVVWCPQDFYWKEWTYWSSCNVNCGIGTQTRVRFCEDGIHGGAPCPKESEKGTKECVNPRVGVQSLQKNVTGNVPNYLVGMS